MSRTIDRSATAPPSVLTPPPPFACGSSLALTAMSKYPEAISYFKKALVLDPENDTYKSNLKIAEQKHKEATSPVSQGGFPLRL